MAKFGGISYRAGYILLLISILFVHCLAKTMNTPTAKPKGLDSPSAQQTCAESPTEQQACAESPTAQQTYADSPSAQETPKKLPPSTLELELAPSLEKERNKYLTLISRSLDYVIQWYKSNGFALKKAQLIDKVIVFGNREEATHFLSVYFNVKKDQLPKGFSGTIIGRTMFLMQPAVVQKTFSKLYPRLQWTKKEYFRLIVHELAHRAHAVIADSIFHAEDGMGPRWFFEGLAITCANQFATANDIFLSWQEMKQLIEQDRKKTLRYPIYRRMFHSVAASFPVERLIKLAGRKDFIASLEQEYLPSDFILERPKGVPYGTILLVHGSAPFDKDGRIPIKNVTSVYAKSRFFRDLAAQLRAAGWSVMRYNKYGVLNDSVNSKEYAQTDYSVLSRQLRNIWRFIPRSRPRVVFAWSEGTLHLRALPTREIDAVILLGGISTNIGDVIRAQGGPSAALLKSQLVKKDRREMLGIDRPVGRLLDELSFDDNWKTFKDIQQLPMLIIHGENDKEVPVSQSEYWKQHLPKNNIRIIRGKGRDHRYMIEGTYDVKPLAKIIIGWLASFYKMNKSEVKAARPGDNPAQKERAKHGE